MTRWLLAALASTCIAQAAAAEGPAASLSHRATLLGDWGGLRARLADRGVTLEASYLSGFGANLRGGVDTGVRYEGFARWGAHLDLERLVGWRGASFHAVWQSYHGGQPTPNLVGAYPTNDLSGWEAAKAVRFYDLYLEQHLWQDRLRLKVGQLAADEDFFQVPEAASLANGAFGNFSMSRNAQLAPFYPLAGPGVVAEVRPWRPLALRGGAYVADVGDDVESNWGFDWSFRHGATFFGEAAWHGHLADHAGSIRFGALGSTQDIRDLDGAVVADGVWNLYASASQDLWLDADGRPRLAAFLRGGFSPGSAAAAIRWFAQAGAVLAGVVPGRADDAVLLGVAYTSFARDYLADLAAHDERASGRETLLEVSYRAQLTPWLQIEPSLQCFFKPHFSRRNAVAFELTAVITL